MALEASGEDLTQQRVVPYVKSHELSVVHDVIKRIAGLVIPGKFWQEKPSRGLVVDYTRAKKRGKHVVQSLADGARGDSFVEFSSTCCSV